MLPLCQQRNLYNNMADVNKPKMQLRTSLSINGDRTPSPATKLLINHGKPNFTIPRSHKAQNGNTKPTSPAPAAACNVRNNNNDFVVKSTTFNGVFKPSNISAATKQTLPQNGNTVTNNGTDNEAAKVILRRAKFLPAETREGDDDENVPEFIRRQRRIQERLANQNILDFENRRSGYFTQVLISPTNPNRQSFVETMASPAVKPGLEMPPPTPHEDKKKEELTPKQLEQQPEVENSADTVTSNSQDEEEEVAKAIEEVNKAVEGEDDDKSELEEHAKSSQEVEKIIESTVVSVTSSLQSLEETKPENDEAQQKEPTALGKASAEETLVVTVTTSAAEVTKPQENSQVETADPILEERIDGPKANGVVEETHIENGLAEENHMQNGHLNAEPLENEITISHTNCLNGPSIPPPDPKGEKGVNFEPKTVVSFSQELGNGDNKYPDRVKVVKDVEIDSDLKELSKLKFEIKADDKDIEVKPVLVTETA